MTWGRKTRLDLIRVIESYIAKKVADILNISLSRVDVHGPLNTLGMDSLMAVELKTAIEEDMGIEFPVEALFLGAGISDLTAHVLWQRTSGRGLEAEDGPLGKVLSSGRQSGEPTERVCAHRNAPEIQPECLPFEDYPEYRNLQQIMLGMKARGIDNPYFRVLEGATPMEPMQKVESTSPSPGTITWVCPEIRSYLKPPKTRSTATVRPFRQAVLLQAKDHCIVSLRKKLPTSSEQRTALSL